MGFDWIWLLSVWQTGPAGQQVSRSNPEWRREFEETLPDLREEDIAGSGFAITGYTVHPSLGGDAALARLRERLRKRGLRLMLDFVPNHTASIIPGSRSIPSTTSPAPSSTWRARRRTTPGSSGAGGDLLLAHGRDPYFPGWPDTLQLDYANPATQEAMIGELLKIAGQCDGVRCDMAMLVLPDVFERTWGRRAAPFWPTATRRVRERVPGFCFMAEVYWDLEWTLQQQGFDYAYDKRLYDRLREGHAPARCASTCTPGSTTRTSSPASWRTTTSRGRPRRSRPDVHEAAAVITFLSPGLRFFHQGSSRGGGSASRRTWSARPEEPVDERAAGVLRPPAGRAPATGRARRASGSCSSAARPGTATGPRTASSPGAWQGQDGERLLVAVNYAAAPEPVLRPPARSTTSAVTPSGCGT